MILDDTLGTPRLAIRPFEPDDAAKLVAIFSDPAVARYVDDGHALSLEAAKLWVVRSGENLRRYGYGTGAVIERASERVIGWAGFARPAHGPEQVIYGLAAAYWRQGFGREIIGALVGFADGRRLGSLAATVDPANTHSITLLSNHGFRFVESNFDGDKDTDLYMRRAPAYTRAD